VSRKPETVFIVRVHQYLPLKVHREAMGTGFSNGTPDRYYEGIAASLWTEYKYLSTIPPLINLMNPKAKVKLSTLQQKWLLRATNNGQNTSVIVGCKTGGVILTNLEWVNPIPRVDFLARIKTRKEIAAWIARITIGLAEV
jgi:hypothetical protein